MTLVERVHQRFPEQTHFVLDTGVARLIDCQDAAYATLYLERLDGILALDREAGGAATGYQLTCEAARQLAVWMSFEGAADVAQDMQFDRRARHTAHHLAEQSLIERWLGAVKRLGFAVQDIELALEIVECACLVKGYGGARRSGIQQFETIFDTIIESGTESDPKKLRAAIRRARIVALSDPDAPPVFQKPINSDPGKPIFWMPRATPGKSGCNAGAKPVEKQMT